MPRDACPQKYARGLSLYDLTLVSGDAINLLSVC